MFMSRVQLLLHRARVLSPDSSRFSWAALVTTESPWLIDFQDLTNVAIRSLSTQQ